MSFPISGSYGTGKGTIPSFTPGTANTIINNYARIVGCDGSYVTIDPTSVKLDGLITDSNGNAATSGIGDFATVGGNFFLVHVAGYKGTKDICLARGKWKTVYLRSVSGTTLRLSKSISDLFEGFSIDDLYVQLVSIPNFGDLILNSGKSITCPQFDYTKGVGGIVAFKCSGELKFNGGHINLTNAGYKDNTGWAHGRIYEPEQVYAEDIDHIRREAAGWENYRTRYHLPINYPNGALYAIVEKMTCHEDSRIGNTSKAGRARSRGTVAELSGGCSIMLAARTIENWTPSIIAKYNSTSGGRGLARCYIATETTLPTDEALYAYDRISTPERLSKQCGIKDFGTGDRGDCINKNNRFNGFCEVIAVSKSRKILTVGESDKMSYYPFKVGGLVMVHLNMGRNIEYAGRFSLARIAAIEVNKITLDRAVLEDVNDWATTGRVNYRTQIISIPEFKNFTLNDINNKTVAFKSTSNGYGLGGIFAIAVSDTCDLRGGQIIVEHCGGGNATCGYGEKGLNYIGNAQMCDRLPIGAGHGSVFILANNLIMDKNTRIGASYTGNALGGINYAKGGTTPKHDVYQTFGALRTKNANGGYGGADAAGTTKGGQSGGYGSNATDGACQGAHVFIVANKITGFNLDAISTGGSGSYTPSPSGAKTSNPGGAGYGGSGGSSGTKDNQRGGNGGFIGGGGGCDNGDTGGGGSGAFCFVYCNQDTGSNYSGVN